MALKKVNYIDNETTITAKNLNEMQDAIIEAEEKAEEALNNSNNGGQAAGVHVGPEAPENGEALWIDTDATIVEDDESGEDIVVEAAQPDWNANEGEPGHVASRTHFVDANGIVHKLPNKFIDADWMATSEDYTAVDTIIPEQKVTSTWSNLQYNLQPGIEYDVIINDAVYPCVAWGSGAVQLGNNTSMTKNDYPFCVYWAGGTAKMGMFFYDSDVFSSPIYLKVTEHAYTKYNTLPDEFLPKSVVKSVNGTKPDEDGNVEVKGGVDVVAQVGQTIRVTEVDADGKPTKWEAADYQPRTHWSEPAEVLPETTCEVIEDIGLAMLPDMAISAGDNLTVIYNGTEYKCTCADMGDGKLAFGNYGVMVDPENPVDTGEPFVAIKTDSGDGTLIWACFPLDGSASFTLSVIGEVHHTVPEKYFPHRIVEVNFTVSVDGSYTVDADIGATAVFQYASAPNTIIRAILRQNGHLRIHDLFSVDSEAATFRFHEFKSEVVIYSSGTAYSTAVRQHTLKAYADGRFTYDIEQGNFDFD